MTRRIEIAVRELRLEGLGAASGRTIASALQAEIARQFADPALVERLLSRADRSALRTAPIRVTPGAPAAEIGRAVARALSEGIRR